MKLNRVAYLIKEGFRSIFTHGFMSFACVAVIVACLLIMGNFALLAVNIDHNIDKLEQQNEILAYVDETLSEAEAREIYVRLSALDNVSSVNFVTREQAMENFISQYEDEDEFSDVTASWFRHRYVIFLDDISLMADRKAESEQVEGIADVAASLELSHAFVTIRNIVSIISVVMIVILFIVSIFIMQNTIKLATFSRREEIGIMKMVGASNGFIRWPFVIEGLTLGLLGSLLAFAAQIGIYDLIFNAVVSSAVGSLITVLPMNVLILPVLIVFVAIGLIVGTFGSNIAIRNYLNV